jgi:hypothetical protein
MRYNGPLSPDQAAAFWRLGMLTGDDISRLAMQWLEEGRESAGLAGLAGQSDLTLRDDGASFERCLRELGTGRPLSEREAAWRYIQTLLIAAREGAIAPLDATHDILEIDRKGIGIFPPRNLAEGKPYAGEELGVEQMLGLYWVFDDVDASEAELAEATSELKVECLRVLDTFYTDPPSSWDWMP